MKTLHYFAFVAIGLLSIACSSSNPTQTQQGSVAQPDWMAMQDTSKLGKPVKEMTEDDWKKKLTPSQYYILREKGTERAFTGKYWNNHQEGLYSCAGCGTALFTSKLKYESGCGWPSFFDSIDEDKIKTQTDMSLGMVRTEIVCAKCDGHLGHVFKDGPPPTGLRYCVNSESLSFAPAKAKGE